MGLAGGGALLLAGPPRVVVRLSVLLDGPGRLPALLAAVRRLTGVVSVVEG